MAPKVTLQDLSDKSGFSVHTISKALRGLPGMSEKTRKHIIQTAKEMGYRYKKITLHDLSAELGISVHTISRALRGLPGMSEETRQEIILTARKLGYLTKEQKYSFAVNKIATNPPHRYRFGLVMDINKKNHSPINQLLMKAIRNKLGELKHHLDIFIVPNRMNKQSFYQWVEQSQIQYVDGIFINPGVRENITQMLQALSVPSIFIGFPSPALEMDSVIWDVYTATHQSVHYLYEHGHTRMMYVGNIHSERGYQLRWNGFCDAMEEIGLTPVKDHQLLQGVRNTQLQKQRFMKKIHAYQPTAIITYRPTSQLYDMCASVDKKIPDDFSLVSNQLNYTESHPEVCRHSFPIKESGTRAAERLLWRMANPTLPYEHIRIRSTFIEGNSVCAI